MVPGWFSSSPRMGNSRSPRYRHEILAQLPPPPDNSLSTSIFRPIPAFRPTHDLPLKLRAAPRVDLSLRCVKQDGLRGARLSCHGMGIAEAACLFRWVSIFSMKVSVEVTRPQYGYLRIPEKPEWVASMGRNPRPAAIESSVLRFDGVSPSLWRLRRPHNILNPMTPFARLSNEPVSAQP